MLASEAKLYFWGKFKALEIQFEPLFFNHPSVLVHFTIVHKITYVDCPLSETNPYCPCAFVLCNLSQLPSEWTISAEGHSSAGACNLHSECPVPQSAQPPLTYTLLFTSDHLTATLPLKCAQCNACHNNLKLNIRLLHKIKSKLWPFFFYFLPTDLTM